MNAELIRRWNKKVTSDDLIYVLGDFIWKNMSDEAPNLLRSLNGHKILIKGNHDSYINNKRATAELEDVKEYDDIFVTLQDGTIKRCILSHYFIPLYNGHRKKAIHLHGHSHISPEARQELNIADNLNKLGFFNEIYNVGCMFWNYEPVTLDEIIIAGQNRQRQMIQQ